MRTFFLSFLLLSFVSLHADPFSEKGEVFQRIDHLSDSNDLYDERSKHVQEICLATLPKRISPQEGWAIEWNASCSKEFCSAAWHWVHQGKNLIQYNHSHRGRWGKPITLSSPDVYACAPRLAIDQHGHACCVWLAHHPVKGWIVQGAEVGRHKEIHPYVFPFAIEGRISDLEVARNEEGKTIIVWTECLAHHSRIGCCCFRYGHPEEAIYLPLSDDAMVCEKPRVVMDAQGYGTIGWLAKEKERGGSFLQLVQMDPAQQICTRLNATAREKSLIKRFDLAINGAGIGSCVWLEREREREYRIEEVEIAPGYIAKRPGLSDLVHAHTQPKIAVGGEGTRVVCFDDWRELETHRRRPFDAEDYHMGTGAPLWQLIDPCLYHPLDTMVVVDEDGNALLYYRTENLCIKRSDLTLSRILFLPHNKIHWSPLQYQCKGITESIEKEAPLLGILSTKGRGVFIGIEKRGKAIAIQSDRGEKSEVLYACEILYPVH